MKVRVAEVFRSGLQYGFVPGDSEEFSDNPSQQINFPPATELFSAAIKGDPSLKNAKPELLGCAPPPAVLQPRNNNEQHPENAPLAIVSPLEKNNTPPVPGASLPLETAAPVYDENEVSTPKVIAASSEDTPDLPPHGGGLGCITETAAPSPGQLQLLHPHVQPTPGTENVIDNSPLAIPPGFEIEIQAGALDLGVAAAQVQTAPVPLFAAGGGGSSGDVNGNAGGFDYFTETQISPATQGKGKNLDPSHAWAAGLTPPALVNTHGAPPPAAAASGRQAHFPVQQQQQQQHQVHVPSRQQNATLPPPHPSVARPTVPPHAATKQPQPPRRGGFQLPPEEVAARKAKLLALQAELNGILHGKDTEEEEDAGGGAVPAGFQLAAGVLRNNINNVDSNQTKQPSPPSPARLSPSTEILSDDMADQLSALEAAAMAAKEVKEKEMQRSGNGGGGGGGGSRRGRERKRSRSPEADSVAPAAPRACIGFMNGFGKAVNVDAKALAAAQRLLNSPEKEEDLDLSEEKNSGDGGEGDVGVPETEEKQVEEEDMGIENPFSHPDGGGGGGGVGGNVNGNVSGGFTTGLGKKVEVPAEQLAAAKRLLDADEKIDAAAAALTPIAATATAAVAVPGRRPSRLGPGGGNTISAPTAALGARNIQQQQRKGRGKFNTPRPAAPGTTKPSFATPGTGNTGNITNTTTKNTTPYAITVPTTSSSTPLHDLKSSALQMTRAQFLQGPISGGIPIPGGQITMVAPPNGGTFTSRWPDCLPLDSLTAAEYIFIEPDGRSVGWQTFHQRLLTAGANKQYATEEWVQNSYRWVVWKLARAEFATGPSAAGQILSSVVAEDELKKRYEREFNRGHRPLLKTVFNQDESAAALAVYMVASIRNIGAANENGGAGATSTTHSSTNTMLELTDGWYWIMAQCDPILTALIQSGKISPGSKIRVMGAELLAPGGPADPLTAARSARLRLHANGVHPVFDNTKLGRQSYRTIYLSLAAVRALGGPIPQTLVVVLRRYPRLLWTKLPSGVATFQTPRVQATAERNLQAERSKTHALAAAQVQKDELARCKHLLEKGKSNGMMSQLDRLYATVVVSNGGPMFGGTSVVNSSQGGGDFIASLNTKDRDALERYTDARRVELEAETKRAAEAALVADLPAAVNAGSIEAAMLLVGEVTHEGIGMGKELYLGRRKPAIALVTVWRPPDDFLKSIKEGEVFAVMGLEPNTNSALQQHQQQQQQQQQQQPLLLPDSILQLDAPFRSCHWRKVASSIAQLPKQLAGQAMPRGEVTLAAMGTVAAAAESEGHQSAVFDFTGVVLNAGPMYQNLNNAAYSHYQWIFFADASLQIEAGGAEEDDNSVNNQWLLAVQLLGPQDAVSWLEPGDVGSVVSLHDLELSGRDDGSRMWRAAGGKHSAVEVHSNFAGGGRKTAAVGFIGGGGGGGASSGVHDVVCWARDHAETVKDLQLRVETLLKG